MKVTFRKHVAWCLAFLMFMIGMAPRVDAGLSPSVAIVPTNESRALDLEKIQKALETKMIRERLLEFGFTEEEINARIGLLSDQELHQLALKLDELRVGGNGLEVLTVLLLIGIFVLLYLYYTGKKIIITE
jgi:hypothetical protein